MTRPDASPALEALEPRQLLSAALVKDLSPTNAGSGVNGFVSGGGLGYFVAADTAAGGTISYSLYRTDATAAGTRAVAALAGVPQNLAASGGLAYFEQAGAGNAKQVWRTDGAAGGTFAVTNFASSSTATSAYTDVNGTLYFIVTGAGGGGAELWKSGGTAATTARVAASTSFGAVANLTVANGTLYFVAAIAGSPYDADVWRTDGTDAGTVRVKDTAPNEAGSSPSLLAGVGGQLYFEANDGAGGIGLWRTDGTAAGTLLVKTDGSTGANGAPYAVAAVDDTLYYVAYTPGAGGAALYKSDGTAGGTGRVADLYPGGNADPAGLTAYGHTLIFAATTAAGGREVWRTDGTAAGTAVVADLMPGPGSSYPSSFVSLGGFVYFTAYDPQHGWELRRTDGTAAGTAIVSDAVPGAGGLNPSGLTALAGAASPRLLFAADDGAHGREPWASDGTAAGTGLVKDLATAPVGSPLSVFATAGNRVFFNGPGGLWVSDGAGAHTAPVSPATIDPYGSAAAGAAQYPEGQQGRPTTAVVGSVLYFRSQGELWRSDGTGSGTYLVSAAPADVASLAAGPGGVVYFSATDAAGGYELWRSDGTVAGTYRVTDLNPGAADALPRNVTAVNGTVLFTTAAGRLYRTDGTAGGTVALVDYVASDDSFFRFQVVGNTLYFSTVGDLWRSDGTAAGTVNLTAGQGRYIAKSSYVRRMGASTYFLATTASGGTPVPGLYRTDGNTAGASTLVKAVGAAADARSQPGYDLTLAGTRLFFSGPDATTLWVSDGTAAGTTTIATFGAAAPISELTAVGNLVYFGSGGRLWVSDGTAAGTAAVANDPAPALTAVKNLTLVDGALLFSATHPLYDNELWSVDAPAAAPAAPSNLTATVATGGHVLLSWADHASNESGFRLERSTSAAFATVDLSVLLPPDRTTYNDRPPVGGVPYYYRVVAYSRSGDSAAAATATATLPVGIPAAPSDLAAVTPNDQTVQLTWVDQATDETGYVVQRGADPDFTTIQLTANLPAGATAYADAGTTALNQYYYRVYATGPGGASDYVARLVATPDRAPSGVRAVGVSASQVDLDWTNGATMATSVRIERAPGSAAAGGVTGAFVSIATVPATQTSYSDLNLPPLSGWTYRVVAIGPWGRSTAGQAAAVTTPPVLTTPVKSLPPTAEHVPSSAPSRVVTVNGVGYFLTVDSELWRTDGTSAGTSLVRKLSYARDLTAAAGTLFFVAAGPSTSGPVLWTSDGTAAGTAVLLDPNPGGNSFIHDLVAYNGKLYFRAAPYRVDSDSLWCSDGTAPGTVEVARFGWRNGGDVYRQTVVSGGKLWLGANAPDGQQSLSVYVSDGTAAGTTKVTTTAGFAPSGATTLYPAGDLAYFIAPPPAGGIETWWRTDGTPQGTFTISNAPVQQAAQARAVGDTMYLPGFQDPVGWELYKIGPTDAAAGLVKDLTSGAGSSTPHALTPFGAGPAGLAFFTTDNASVTLYVTGGTAASTTLVKQFPTAANATVAEAYAAGGSLYFFVHEASGQWALYRSDGTTAGTAVLRRFAGPRAPGPFAPLLGGAIGFAADDGVNGLEPWRTDGTAAGTALVKDLAYLTLATKPDSMVNFNGAIYFTYSDFGISNDRGAIYRTDGTATGTSVVYDGSAANLFVAGNCLYFSAYTPDSGIELWVSDGTTAGTHMVADVAPGTASAVPTVFGWLGGNTLLFGVPSGDATTYNLWRTDGTATGTAKVYDKLVSAGGSYGITMTPVVMNGVLYFSGFGNGTTGSNLWRSDGTATGTRLVKAILPGASPDTSEFVALGNAVYFRAFDATQQWGLWRTDGTTAGTVKVALTSAAVPTGKMTAVSGALCYGTPAGTWRSDGTAAGTVCLSADATSSTGFTAVGGTTYFIASTGLWKTDGTPAGTARVRAMGLGKQGYLVNVAGTLFVSDGTFLWRSDGTFEGTSQVMRVSDSSNEQAQMTFNGALAAALGDLLLFGALTPDGGRELRTAYATPPAAPDTLAIAAAAVPASPTPDGGGTAAPLPGPAGVRLTWADRSTNESGFVVDRSTTADFAALTGQFFVGPNVTTYTDPTASVGDHYFYRVRTFNAAGRSAASNSVTAGAPGLLASAYDFARAAPAVSLRFSADVSASLAAGTVHLRNLTTGADVPAGQYQVAYARADNAAVVTFVGGRPADGRYRLTLRGAEVVGSSGLALDGNGDGAAGGDFALDFFEFKGDADRNQRVDFNDLVPLAQHYNVTDGKRTWADGDFTGDGNVDFNDLVKLAQNYNTSLAAAVPAAGSALSFDAARAAAFASVATPVVSPPPAVKPKPPVVTPPVAKPKPSVVVKPPAVSKPPAPVPRSAKPAPKPVVKMPARPVAKAVTAAAKAPAVSVPPPASTFGTTRIKDGKKAKAVW